MGAAAAILLFGSVLAHELSHALVALQHRIPIRGITLFIFGGAAEMGDESPNPAVELKVALAGPAMERCARRKPAPLQASSLGSECAVGRRRLPVRQGIAANLLIKPLRTDKRGLRGARQPGGLWPVK